MNDLKLLSENLKDKELALFFRSLMESEAGHYTLFLNFARNYGDRKIVDDKWQKLLIFEAEIMKSLGSKETIHG